MSSHRVVSRDYANLYIYRFCLSRLSLLSCHHLQDTEVRIIGYCSLFRPNNVHSYALHRLGQYILSCHHLRDTELCLTSSRLTGYGPSPSRRSFNLKSFLTFFRHHGLKYR